MEVNREYPIKIMVTGSRGKSSLVRLVHSALLANGIKAYGRITGVLPRELTPDGEVQILRSSGGHVEEMKWWLSSIPEDVQAVVMENSAVSPDLQSLASKWFSPGITLLSNIHPDHQEAWGPDEIDAALALSRGIGPGAKVILGPGLENKKFLLEILDFKNCKIMESMLGGNILDFREKNILTASRLCEFLHLDMNIAERAMRNTPPDIADFRVIGRGSCELAFAFSANDIESTGELFRLLEWPFEETMVLYNHRRDRSSRLKSFKKWILDNPWGSICMIGDYPFFPWTLKYYRRSKNLSDLLTSSSLGMRVFGCGNVAGLPLEFVLGMEE